MKDTDNTSFAHVLEQTQSEVCVLMICGSYTGSTSPSKLNVHLLWQLAQAVRFSKTPRLFL
jgi:hypothetical protein